MDTDPSSLPSNLEDLDPVISQTSEPEPATADAFPTVEVPLSDLWNAISNSCYYCVHEPVDLFQELQDALASGDMPFYTPASHSIPTCNDLGVDDGSDPDFGIELPSEEEPAPGSTHVDFQVSVDNPAYPWPSKVVRFNHPLLDETPIHISTAFPY
ncbi:hypothetical protein M404DRAFT_32063 [Pisolithus tinctorius Marx 270]|uniref:Uncharacterized protein n=1 Tax=Pisolithus tinctorius Marx 270 TaxID=870435 RepID=A0A0C3NQY0_PISTI|nr:hypothetical protein M404DRAFT_32063 [Pisolithus tinctorius Marx 270]